MKKIATIQMYLNTLRQKGYLAYEYNPFHNYQTKVDLYLIDDQFLVPEGQAVNTKNGELLTKKNGKWVDKRGQIITENIAEAGNNKELYAKAGSLIDLDTDQLNFDLDHPVDIEVQPSYDGSVNLIINDDKNIPRLINSRFSVREKNTYEIVDRIGENDTNVYNSETFDKDTSLYFQYESNPTIKYNGFVNGVLPVGQYVFYFTYCDADENESDYIAESGIIPVFIGSDKDPNSIDGGIKNQNSNKGINLQLTNLDNSYSYLKVYYVRYFADYQQNRVYECKKIYQKYPIKSNYLFLHITGNEAAEDIDANILNISRFNPQSILTQAQCKNMLFFGNIVKNSDNYKELQDCALRIIPQLEKTSISTLNERYTDDSEDFGYYNSRNIYNKVGYFPEEYYRFGVVFIYYNGTLSNVYNTLGCALNIPKDDSFQIKYNSLYEPIEGVLLKRRYFQIDDFGWIKNGSEIIENILPNFLNGRGVCYLNESLKDDEILGIKFTIPNDVIKYLKEELNIRGLFFVRQKNIPSILAQCYLMPMDESLHTPILEVDGEYKTECFLEQKSNQVTNSYEKRLYIYKKQGDSEISKHAYAAICPDFLLNQPYYNQIFNGAKFKLKRISDGSNLVQENQHRMYHAKSSDYQNLSTTTASICTVTEDVPSVALEDKIFKLEVGNAEEVFRFEYAEYSDSGSYNAGDEDFDSINNVSNLVRGMYSPYLAIYSNQQLKTGEYYYIYQDNYNYSQQEFQNRMDSYEPFYAICDRYNFEQLQENNKLRYATCYRGDCYNNTFTFRLNRNFNDPSLPNNDKIIDQNTWKDNYNVLDSQNWENISRSDINAVQMGSWITLKVRSAMNYALRSQDHSYVSEEALMGSPRSFYPKNKMMWLGNHKLPDSYLFNDAYRATLGFKCYFTLQDINYIKDTFSNRIQYSAITVQDSFKNNYRYSLQTYFRDYSQEYGGITKLVGFEGYLLVIFEHAIGVAVINERVLAGNSDGEPVFINTQNVLPETLTIITDTYGTQWGESIVKTDLGYVYGVDTIAKKIWRVKGQELEILSDFKVNKFLINNISLGERELYPIVGLKNVKTHYNNNKKDIMFTFYDDVYKDEEKVWNLCYNELLGEFVTFYSWVPSYSENIDTQFFTFNRNTAKGLTLLGKCNYSIPENTGVVLDSPILDDNYKADLYYIQEGKVEAEKYIGGERVNIETRYIPNILFELKHDHWKNYEYFDIIYEETEEILVTTKEGTKIYLNKATLTPKKDKIEEIKNFFAKYSIMYLEITPKLEKDSIISQAYNDLKFPTETIALSTNDILKNKLSSEDDFKNPNLGTFFYLHGQSGIFDITEDVYPCYWYKEEHPFEFEVVVNDAIGQQKIFSDLIIISNKAEPESFHFEIEGDNYDFSSDKRTMYFRQEATKELYQNLGSDILYNRGYTDIISQQFTYEQHYRGGNDEYSNRVYSEYKDLYNNKFGIDKVYPITSHGLVQQAKSTIFPLYYEKIDTYNEIYHNYQEMKGNGYDFKNLSGSEILWNRDLNQFNVVTHIKNSPVDLVGRLRGNSRYKEGKWHIQIPPITFMQKNENTWKDNKPPIVINSSNLPKDIVDNEISFDKVPNIYTRTKDNSNVNDYIKVGDWTYRKETRIRDKWMKVRVRYSGRNLAIIHSIVTLYNISYS